MSGWGHSRHFGDVPVTSGLPRSADILRAIRHVAKVARSRPADFIFFATVIVTEVQAPQVGSARELHTSTPRPSSRDQRLQNDSRMVD